VGSNYDQIRAENIIEYGQGTRHLGFLERLYSDRTHFIFELLQNAEDAQASRVSFELFADRLEVRHDGRPFNEKDVRGICGVAEGTKEWDFNQIGKFGIGFKSVYAYTSNPEIHSGEEHFLIEAYVRPRSVEEKPLDSSFTTLFIFPFDRHDVPREQAFTEIKNRFKRFDEIALLFLRKIAQLRLIIARGTDRETEFLFSRETEFDQGIKTVNLRGTDCKSKQAVTSWLVFEKPVQAPLGQDVKVELAFRTGKDPKNNLPRIIKSTGFPLFAYFPTEKPTYFGFVINGPYRTTPARDNIPENDTWNKQLIEETSTLLIETLSTLKDHNLLTVEVLQCLPIKTIYFRDFFSVMFVKLKSALLNEKLLPSDEGNFIAGKDAVLARASELRELLPSEVLTNLLGASSAKHWVSGEITADKPDTADLWVYLKEDLKIRLIAGERFAELITTDFLKSQSDSWMEHFYEFLFFRSSLWRSPWSPLRKKEFIRVQDGGHVRPFDDAGKPNAYLPVPDGNSTVRTVMRCFERGESCLHFFKTLGLTEPDLKWEISELILPKYHQPDLPISPSENIRDLKRISLALGPQPNHFGRTSFAIDTEKPFRQIVETTPIFFAQNLLTGSTKYKRAKDNLFITPDYFERKSITKKQTSNLEMFFQNCGDAWLLDERYSDSHELANLVNKLLIKSKPTVQQRDHPADPKFKYCRGAKDYYLFGLREFLQLTPTTEKSLFLWNLLKEEYRSNQDLLIGELLLSNNASLPSRSTTVKNVHTSIHELLTTHTWLPSNKGGFFKPYEICLSDLPMEFFPETRESRKLAEDLYFKPDLERQYFDQMPAQQKKLFELVKCLPDNLHSRVESLIEEEIRKTAFPNSSDRFPEKITVNPERRSTKVAEMIEDATQKEYVSTQRSVRISNCETRVSAKDRLRNDYTNSEDETVCQICEKVMPFKLQDGNYYFEAVECIPEQTKELEQNYLALCPVCAAKYRYVKQKDSETITKEILDIDIGDLSPRVPIKLAGSDCSIRFVHKHLIDLRAALETTRQKN
jgi:hypothetical protein